jgi:hypothetical protein
MRSRDKGPRGKDNKKSGHFLSINDPHPFVFDWPDLSLTIASKLVELYNFGTESVKAHANDCSK